MDGQHLTSKSKVCELHFAESDIIKGKTVKKDGRDSFILHKYGRLKANAVPVRLCGSSPTSDIDEHLSPQASEGTTRNSVIAVREPTCRFVQLGGTNIVNSTIQQNAGEKRPLDTANLPTESNASKRNCLDGAALNVSSGTSPQVASASTEQQAMLPGLTLEERVLNSILSSSGGIYNRYNFQVHAFAI